MLILGQSLLILYSRGCNPLLEGISTDKLRSHSVLIMRAMFFVGLYNTFLGACAKFRWAKTSLVISFCPSLSCRLDQLVYYWTNFHDMHYLSIFFRKSVDKIQVSLKSDKNDGYLTWRHSAYMIITRWILLRVTNISEKVVEGNKAHVWSSGTFLLKIVSFVRLYGRVWRNRTVHR